MFINPKHISGLFFLATILLSSIVMGNNDTLTGAEKIKQYSSICWSLREKNPDSALWYARQGITLGDSIGFIEEHDQLYGFSGVIYMHYKQDIEAAIPYLQNAMEYALKTNDSVVIAYTYNNLGDAYYLTGNGPLALEYARISLNYFNKLKHIRGIAYGYVNLGLFFRFEHLYDSSLYYFNKAIELRETINDKLGVASAHLEIARTYLDAGEVDSAELYYMISFDLHEEIDNKSWMAYSLNGLAEICYLRGEYKCALENYQESLQLNMQRNQKYGIVRDKLGIALVYSKMGFVEKGRSVLTEAMQLAKKHKIPVLLLETYEVRTEFYLNLADYQMAEKSLQEFLSVYDSVYTLHQHKTLADIQHRFRINQELEKVQIELDVQQERLWYLIILIVLLLAITFILIWRYVTNKKMNNKLKLMNEAKDKLFSVISHDLSSPFNSLLGFSEILLEDIDKGNLGEIKNYAANINKTAGDAYRLVVNLLEWSRVQRGKWSFNPEFYSLITIVEEAVDVQESSWKNKKINIEIDIPETLEIYADRNMLSSILRNLLSNSIKFSHEGGGVKISGRETDSEVCIIVEDHGVGMTVEKQQELFNISENVSTPGTQKEKGTGLGLVICKDFTEMHHGRIKVDSHKGEGSSFMVCLPLERKRKD